MTSAAPTPTSSARPAPPPASQRFDLAGRLGKFERTASGGLRIPAFIARTGVQVYQDANGRAVREFRPASEVFDESSYRSFEGAPVTRLHPEDMVSPSTWRAHAIGHVRNVRPDGDRLAADLFIEDGQAIAEIEAGELVETSSGYTAHVAPSPGADNGDAYDAVQQVIRGNHVALGPEGWGRAGPSVRLRIDAAHQVLSDEGTKPAMRRDSMSTKHRVDGIEYDAGSASHLQAVDRELGKVTTERDTAQQRVDELEAQIKTVTKERDEAKKRADEATSEEEVDSRITKRLSLVDQARTLLGGKYKWQGKSDRQIMVDALRKAGVTVDSEASSDFVSGAFSAALSKAKSAADAEGEEAPAEGGEGEGGEEEEPTEDGRGRGDGGFFVAPYRSPKKDGNAPTKASVAPPISAKYRR